MSDEEEVATDKKKVAGKVKRAALADYGFDQGDDSDDEGDDDSGDEAKKPVKKQALQYDELTKHGYKTPKVKITEADIKKPAAPAAAPVENTAAQQPPEEDVLLTAEEKAALEKLQKDLAYDPKRDTWRRRGKIGGETPNDTWKREQKKIKMGLADVGGGMKHLSWTAGMSMGDVKLLRGSFDG